MWLEMNVALWPNQTMLKTASKLISQAGRVKKVLVVLMSVKRLWPDSVNLNEPMCPGCHSHQEEQDERDDREREGKQIRNNYVKKGSPKAIS